MFEKSLQRLRENDPSLTNLYLLMTLNTKIGAEGAKSLSDALLKNTNLTTLNLDNNNIGAEGARSLSDALLTNTSLTSLNVGSNNIGIEGVKSLSDALLENTTLTTLKLGWNKIGAEGAKNLSDTLLENTSLTTLDLGVNKIGADGAESLSNALLTNTSLTTLYLCCNNIGDWGAKNLSDVLLTSTSLTTLDLGENNIGDEGAESLSDALVKNTSLTSLNLSDNYIRDAGLKKLKAGLSQNASIIFPLIADANEMERYVERNMNAHNKAQEAVIAVLKIGKLWIRPKEPDPEVNDDSVFENLLRKTGSGQRQSYLIDMAKELWNTRHERVWWTEEEREEAKRVLEENKLVQTCIASHICNNKAILMEVSDPTQVFCSSYCQFMHYTGAPDLRGMNAEQIKQALN